MDHLNSQEKRILQDINEREDAKAAEAEDNGPSNNSKLEEEQPTHNRIF